MSTPLVEVGQVALLGPQRSWWLARARSADGRYVLLTTVQEQPPEDEPAAEYDTYDKPRIAVAYTLVDHQRGIRGAIDVVGHGVGIRTVCGPDEHVAEALRMVVEDGFEVSRRNHVALVILEVRRAC